MRQRRPRGADGQAGQPGAQRRLVAGQLAGVGRGPDPGAAARSALPVPRQRARPARRDQLRDLGGAGETADQRGGTLPVRAQREHLPGVRVRRAALGQQVVAVVPEHDQAEVVNGGEHGGAGARRDPHRAAQHRQPAPVPFGRAEIGGQADVLAGPSRAASAASTRARSLTSGTTMTTPRPAEAVAAAATAISSGHSGPGSADQAARTPRPSASAVRNAAPAGYRAQEPGPGPAPGRLPAATAWPRFPRAGAGWPAAARRRGCPRTGRRPPGRARRSPG